MTAVTFSAAPAMPMTPRAAAARPVARRPRLRLTPRGRAVFTTLAALPLVITAMFIGLNGGGAVATNTKPDASFEWVTVGAGESLWELAAEIAPQEDPREFAAQVVSLNQLPSSDVLAGQRLAIPAQYTD